MLDDTLDDLESIEAHEIDGGLRWQVFASQDACAEKTCEVETLLR